MNFPLIMVLCQDRVWILVWHKCDTTNKEHLWIVTLKENIDFSEVKWRKSLKFGGNVLQQVVNAMTKEKMLNARTIIVLQKKTVGLSHFEKKMTEKWRERVIWFKVIFFHLTVEISSSNFFTHINGWIEIAYKLWDDPAWQFLIA